jgi:hypothetical protein
MKTGNLILLCLLGLLASACVKTETVERPVAKNGGTDPQGGGWTGGGNGTEFCQPLESCRYYPENSEEYPKYIAPVIALVESKAPGMAVEMRRLFTDKGWYLGPEHAEVLPSGKIGVTFRTDRQLALQSKHEVWIARDSFLRLTQMEKVHLIVHEMLMALRVAVLLEERSDFWEHLPNRKAKDLSAEDYQQIRLLTGNLVEGRLRDLPPEEFVAWLARNGFKKYPPGAGSAEFPIGSVLKQEHAYEYLESKLAMNLLPRSGVIGNGDAGISGVCDFRFAYEGGTVKVSLDFAGAEGAKLAIKAPHNAEPIKVEYKMELGMYFEIAEFVDKPRPRARRYLFRFVFHSNRVQRVHAIRQIYEITPHGYRWQGPEDVKAYQNVTCGI